MVSRLKYAFYAQSQYQFGSDVTSASFAFNCSRGRGATLTRAARRYAFCVYTEQALILSDVTTKLLVTWIVPKVASCLISKFDSVFNNQFTNQRCIPVCMCILLTYICTSVVIIDAFPYHCRTRDDTVRCIVSSLTDDSNRELAEELVKAEPLHMDESYSSEHEEEKPEEWLPDPIDADPSKYQAILHSLS